MPRLAPTVVSLTMSAAEKANLILQPGRLPRINDPPSFLLRGVSRQKKNPAWRQTGVMSLPTLGRWTRTVYISRPVCDCTKPAVASQKERRRPRHKRPDHRVSFVLFKPARAAEDEGMFVLGYLCVSTCVCLPSVCATHHFLVGELPSLDAATVSHGLLVPLALGVAEQVHLRGDLQTQTRRSEVTAVDTMEKEAGEGQQRPTGRR